MWHFAPYERNAEGILNFAISDYKYAYTQAKLPLKRDKNLPFFEDFSKFLVDFFHSSMEEFYYTLDMFGAVDSPVSSYYFIYIASSIAMLSPVFIVLYFYVMCNCIKKVQ